MMSLVDSLYGPLGQRLTWTLIHFLWQGLGVALVLAVLLWTFRVRQAAIRYAAGVIALLAMVACLPATFTLLNVPEPTPVAVEKPAISTGEFVEFNETPGAEGMGRTEAADAEYAVIPSLPEPVETPPASGVGASPMPSVPTLSAAPATQSPLKLSRLRAFDEAVLAAQPYLLMLWIAGVLLLSIRLLLGLAGLSRLGSGKMPVPAELRQRITVLAGRLGLRRIPSAFRSAKVGEALALGFLRPMILIPAAWLTEMTPEVLEAVIAHELAHIRRWDLWVNLFQRLVETLLFYHPAVWWLSHRIRLEREMCCDELAVAATGRRAAYADALHQVTRQRLRVPPPAAATATTMGGNQMAILKRVRYVLGVSPAHGNLRLWPVGLLTVLVPAILWYSLSGGAQLAEAEDDTTVAAVETAFQEEEFAGELAEAVETASQEEEIAGEVVEGVETASQEEETAGEVVEAGETASQEGETAGEVEKRKPAINLPDMPAIDLLNKQELLGILRQKEAERVKTVQHGQADCHITYTT